MDSARFQQLLSAFANKKLLVIGDVMLDRFVFGSVGRISPEAPVPVVEVTHETSCPGGAANVARNLLPFCAKVSVVGQAGQDGFGAELDEQLSSVGIHTAGLRKDADCPTIVKTRIVSRGHHLVRVDREKKKPLSDERLQDTLAFLRAEIPQLDAIIIEDYGKGFITQGLLDGLAELVAELKPTLPVTVDPNPNNPLQWRGATAIKPNRSEAFHAAGLSESSLKEMGLTLDQQLAELGERLFAKWATPMLLITLSEQGMALLRKDQPAFRLPTQAREVFDVSGAGDTAIALFTLALASGATPEEAAELSNHASGIVVGKVGTATLTPTELQEAVCAS